jgi:hypothetical protein
MLEFVIGLAGNVSVGEGADPLDARALCCLGALCYACLFQKHARCMRSLT